MTSPQKPGKQEKNGVKYFKHWERKHTHTTQNSIFCRIILQKWKRNKIVSQTKTKNWGNVFPRPALQEMFKEVLKNEGKLYRSEKWST